MKIQIMTIHVDDQAKALRFYSDVLAIPSRSPLSIAGRADRMKVDLIRKGASR